jgi:hypothetical protein
MSRFSWLWTWFSSSHTEPKEKITRLCSEDSSLTRARKICQHAGITMDRNSMALLPAMVEVLDAYKQLDEEARLQQ